MEGRLGTGDLVFWVAVLLLAVRCRCGCVCFLFFSLKTRDPLTGFTALVAPARCVGGVVTGFPVDGTRIAGASS
ncbi:hypothetical protein PR003_g27042 [Phytophthora rubi]|uniref:Uncharacterized protein n=1 Tax=Phytophthora rubi TaxID=129364 RepID=A0A6A3I8U3_9STRA|nr:hypothetical protein PR001_g24898 [Phytophthora rubi]KAE9283747.1 hypothetical protein PR003_g27042 [Phytophthora rubi]